MEDCSVQRLIVRTIQLIRGCRRAGAISPVRRGLVSSPSLSAGHFSRRCASVVRRMTGFLRVRTRPSMPNTDATGTPFRPISRPPSRPPRRRLGPEDSPFRPSSPKYSHFRLLSSAAAFLPVISKFPALMLDDSSADSKLCSCRRYFPPEDYS